MTRRSSRVPLRAAVLGATLVVLSACGSAAADAPTDASLEDFCNASAAIDRSAGEFAAGLAEVGTPEGVSAQVRDGFVIYVDALDEKGDEAYDKARSSLAVRSGDTADGNAFIGYMTETCERYFTDLAADVGEGTPPTP